jgi:hypothetical protein
MGAGHKYFLAVARKFRYPGSPIFSAEKIWFRPSATQRKQNHLLASPAQKPPSFRVVYCAGDGC